MSDIDFDELDRAVASVLKSDDPQTAAAVATIAEAAPSPVVQQPSAPFSEPEAAEPIAVTVTTPVVDRSAQALHSVPVKPIQRGRFLDMVHPSQDMAARASRPVPTPSVTSAQAAPISANKPFVSDVVAPEPSAPVQPITPPVTAPEPAVTPEVTTPQPESIDFFAASPDDSNPHKAPEVPASPFIPDAKVEKRPLGAFNPDAQPSVTLPVGDDLHKQITAIESEDNIARFDEQKPEPATKTADGKLLLHPVSTEPIAPAVVQPTPVVQPVAGAEKPKHHLFGHHHEATATPKLHDAGAPKYGSGAFIYITIGVAIILIGLGVGASLYFLVLK